MTQRFGVYVNLTRGGFSICALKTDRSRGPVVAHAQEVILSDVRCVVSEGGRIRSVTKSKEVHAWLSCHVVAYRGEPTEAGRAQGFLPSWDGKACDAAFLMTRQVRYNPAIGPTFFLGDTLEPVDAMAMAYASNDDKARVYTHD